MIEEKRSDLSTLQIWWLAARPKTLPAAAAPVIVGSAAAFHDGGFSAIPAMAALLAALLLQIGANLANDVYDFRRGADSHVRQGPLRVTQAGLLQPGQVLTGMWVTFSLAALLGLYLTAVAGWPVAVMGLLAIAAAIGYTGGPFPLGYYGLGELFVFLFFGLAAVAGTYFVQTLQVSSLAWWTAVPMGLLSSGILVVNNLRDIHTDREAGKRTLAVRLGERGARLEYLACLVGAYLVPWLVWGRGLASGWVLLTWFSLPLAVPVIRLTFRQTGRPLNRALADTGRLELVFGLLFSLGLVLLIG